MLFCASCAPRFFLCAFAPLRETLVRAGAHRHYFSRQVAKAQNLISVFYPRHPRFLSFLLLDCLPSSRRSLSRRPLDRGVAKSSLHVRPIYGMLHLAEGRSADSAPGPSDHRSLTTRIGQKSASALAPNPTSDIPHLSPSPDPEKLELRAQKGAAKNRPKLLLGQLLRVLRGRAHFASRRFLAQRRRTEKNFANTEEWKVVYQKSASTDLRFQLLGPPRGGVGADVM